MNDYYEIKIFDKKSKKYVKSENYGDTYYISLDFKVIKYEYSPQYGDRLVRVNQDDYIIEINNIGATK